MNRRVRWTPLFLVAIVLTIATTGQTAANTDWHHQGRR